MFSFVARNSTRTVDRSTRVLRVAHVLPTSHPVHRGIELMARRAEELSGGRLKLEIFPSEQLGSEVQCLEQVQAGTLAITKVGAGAIGNFVATYKVFGLPYLFRDAEHCWKVLDGPFAQELLTLLGTADDGQSSGLRGLCFYDAGSRSFYTKEPVRSPQDLKGKKIRTNNDPVAMELVQALGGSSTPIPWGELYTALQQRVVDGAENNPPSYLSSRHYEVCKYFTLNHHTRVPDVLIVSSKIWERLSPEEQGWLQQAADESSDFQRKLWAEESDKALAELKKAGVEIFEVDAEPFRKATEPVLAKYSQGKIGELVRRIQQTR
ncbi:MAG: TRAP transporter substrate-binding protein [Verrucomicrobia bacterium]|nr:TRAP transporter substrate-binding protein [Verrucomicrobiota bacterium]